MRAQRELVCGVSRGRLPCCLSRLCCSSSSNNKRCVIMILTIVLSILIGSTAEVSASEVALREHTFVNFSLGLVRGTLVADGCIKSFKGVQFAEHPIRELRYADPVGWSRPYPVEGLDATAYGSKCISTEQQIGASESCLFLNIWSPANATRTSLLPVLFFVHGGSFTSGAGSMYDGSRLAHEQHAVVVTTNYRLGNFGFLQTSAGYANWGLKDQREALRFVSREIRAVGGDPSSVLLFGQSAGGISVHMHLVMKASEGLFAAVLSESGFPSATSQRSALDRGTALFQAAGCVGENALACLRNISTSGVLQASKRAFPPGGNVFESGGFGPSIDGVAEEIPLDPLRLLREGRFNRNVKVAGGSNTNEGALFVYPFYPTHMSNDTYVGFVKDVLYSDRVFDLDLYTKALELYPPSATLDNRPQASTLLGDLTFICGTRYLLRLASTYSTELVHSYTFNYSTGFPGGRGPVLHSAELPFVFGDAQSLMPRELKSLSQRMGALWVGVVKGWPQGPDSWPEYNNVTDACIVLEPMMNDSVPFPIESGRRATFCDFWDGFYASSQ